MAYNLQPLITILEQIFDPQQICFIHDNNKPQLKSLLEKAVSLQQILEKSSSIPDIEISLEREIRDAAHKAEDIIESRMVNQMLCTYWIGGWLIKWCKCFAFSVPDLQQVTQELDCAMEKVVKLVEVEAGEKMISSRGTASSSVGGGASLNPKSATASGSIMVGFDEDLMELKDRLTGTQRKLEIIPIVGMGGAGKTTLARNLYEDPTIVSCFQYRAWATVSQDFNMRTILLSLVRCITGNEVDREVNELKDILYKNLYGRRYLIVLDDIWSTQVWDEMRMYFPDNSNGSRVVITTRESNVAKYANSQSRQHEVQLLSESASWNLLRQLVFGDDDCPVELGSMGRKIANDCGGLPLAITVIGGLLSKVKRSKYVWENIGENVITAIAKSEKGGKYSNIMSLSYNHLPNYLKPCFLYMGAFPEDYEIKGLKLICLWIAEGFVKSNRDKSLEEEAEEYLKGLVERNLVMVSRYKSNKKPTWYVIHDVLRDLCIKKAHEDRFLHLMTNDRGRSRAISNLRRVSGAATYAMGDTYASKEVMSLARSFLYTDLRSPAIVRSICFVSVLLRVLDLMEVLYRDFPKEILILFNLRYLGVYCADLGVGISGLVNLQTLCVRVPIWSSSEPVPSEIWTMSGLRHLRLSGSIRWREDGIKELVQMNKLQTISGYLVLTESLLERGFLQTIPNIKNLGVHLEGDLGIDFSHLNKLETIRCRSLSSSIIDGCQFPPTLRKLLLSGCTINSRTMLTLCGLPNLEVLKIRRCSFDIDGTNAEEWESREGEEFRSLQFLQLDDLKLVRWKADDTNFPKLRHLVVQKCPHLEEIPSGIGEIATLDLIEIKGCNASTVESAEQIVEEQQSEYGNYALQLRIHHEDDVDAHNRTLNVILSHYISSLQ